MRTACSSLTLLAPSVLLGACLASAQTPGLAGTSWQLVRFQGGDDSTMTPDDRSKYTMTFGADGSLVARIDCNRGRGTWKVDGPGQLQLGPLALTRAMCPPGSLHDRIVKHWEYIRSYIIKDGHLFLSLMADGGIYEFEPMPGAKPGDAAAVPAIRGTATYKERMALPADAVFEATLEDVSRADAPADVIARTRVTPPGQPPIAFELAYDPARIQENHSYVVRARIVVDKKPIFTADTSNPVLTRGNGNMVTLTLRRVGAGAQP